MSRRTSLTGLVVVAVFLAGAVSGAAVYRAVAGADAGEVASDSGVDGSEPVDGGNDGFRGPRVGGDTGPRRDDPDPTFMFAEYLEEELALSDEQRTSIDDILERHEEAARQLFLESRSRFVAQLEAAVAEVETVLDEDQAEEFRALVESMEQRFLDRDDDGDR